MVCVRGLWTGSRSGGSEAQRGVYRSRGGRGGEPLDIHISIQVTRGSFNVHRWREGLHTARRVVGREGCLGRVGRVYYLPFLGVHPLLSLSLSP